MGHYFLDIQYAIEYVATIAQLHRAICKMNGINKRKRDKDRVRQRDIYIYAYRERNRARERESVRER